MTEQSQNPQSSLEELVKAIDSTIDSRLNELLPNYAAYIPYINLITPKELTTLINDNNEKISFEFSSMPLFQYLVGENWFRNAVREKIAANIRGAVISEITKINSDTIAELVAFFMNK